MTIQRIETLTRMSKVVIHGDTVYLAGFNRQACLWSPTQPRGKLECVECVE
jgi:hypothetical protein